MTDAFKILVLSLLLVSCQSERSALQRHEDAHCNGWVHTEDNEQLVPPLEYDYLPKTPTARAYVSIDQLQALCGIHPACALPLRNYCVEFFGENS